MGMNNKRDLLYVLIGLSPAIGALVLYNRLPETMATHFGPSNEVNGTMGKGAAILVLALIGLVPILMRVMRNLDPKRAEYQTFSTAFEVSRFGTALLVTAAGWAIVVYNLGYALDIRKIALIAVGLLFAVMGNYLTQVRQNYLFGIRTPWTLADAEGMAQNPSDRRAFHDAWRYYRADYSFYWRKRFCCIFCGGACGHTADSGCLFLCSVFPLEEALI